MYSIYTGTTAIYAPAGVGSRFLVLKPRYTQEVNKAGQLELTLTPESNSYGKLKRLVTPISLYQDSEEIFFGRVFSTEKDFYNHEEVTVEGALAFLHDVVIRPFAVVYDSGDVVKKYITYLLNKYNQRVENWKKIYPGNITVTDSNNYLYRYKDSHNDVYDVLMDHTVNSSLGGYLSTRRYNGKTYLDYTAEPGETSNQVIQFGENLLDLTHYVSAENVYTVIIPVGKEVNGKKTTIRTVNDDKDYIESATGISLFGRIEKSVEYSDVSTPSGLKSVATRDLKNAIKEAMSIDIKAVDLHLINPLIGGLKYGTMVRVLSIPHDIDEIMMCRKVDINLNEADDAVYTLGAEKVTLSGQQAKTSKGVVVAASAADTAILDATEAKTIANEAITSNVNNIIIGDGAYGELDFQRITNTEIENMVVL